MNSEVHVEAARPKRVGRRRPAASGGNTWQPEMPDALGFVLKRAPWEGTYAQAGFLKRLLIVKANGHRERDHAARLADLLGISDALAADYLSATQDLPPALIARALALSPTNAEFLMLGTERHRPQSTPLEAEEPDAALFLTLYQALPPDRKAAFGFIFNLANVLHGLPREVQRSVAHSLQLLRERDTTDTINNDWWVLFDAAMEKFRIREGFNPLLAEPAALPIMTPLHALFGIQGPEREPLVKFVPTSA
jgi:hypothetical protein